ncbi:MAG TPA: VWA domain-containing protein [Blastocatellia bacterium]|jgi:Ca-activated chloride channel family protein|nr:VWA domain-containing protein [Blastocatellia bacterium]
MPNGTRKRIGSASAALAALIAIVLTAHQMAGAQEEKAGEPHRKRSRNEEAQRRDASGQDEPVQIHSDLVVVNATVIDAGGQYVHGLKGKEFTIQEDGTTQQVDSFVAEEAPFAAAILIDMSGSMEYKFGLVRGAAASFVDHIRDSDQVAVYGFNNEIQTFQDFSNSRDISEYVWDATAKDVTRMYDCMDLAIESLKKRPERRRALVLISDGWDSSSKASLESVMRKALAEGVTIYTVDLVDDNLLIGNASYVTPLRRGRAIMQSFATETGGQYLHTPQGEKLESGFTNIVDELRNQYTLAYYSNNDKRDGKWRKLRVDVSRGGLMVRARRGYYAPKGR